MATNFPSSLDNFTNPVSGNTLDSPSHSLQHSDANDAIEAIEAKLGVGASPAGSATAGQVLTISAAGTSGWSTPTIDGLVAIVPSSVSVGSGSSSVSSNGQVSFSGASSVSLNDVFSSTYDCYRVFLDYTGSTSLGVSFRFRVSGSDNSTSSYQRQVIYNSNATTVTALRSSNVTSVTLTNVLSSSNRSACILDFTSNPNATIITGFMGFATDDYNAIGQTIGFNSYGFNATTSFTGFSLIASTGNITGSVSVYGYRK